MAFGAFVAASESFALSSGSALAPLAVACIAGMERTVGTLLAVCYRVLLQTGK